MQNHVSIVKLSDEDVRVVVQQLEGALSKHTDWLKRLHRVVICRLAPDPDNLADNAHHRCEFGRWYYQDAHPSLRDNEVFRAIGEMHQIMHGYARDLLIKMEQARQFGVADYDTFINQSIAFHARVRQLQLDILNHLAVSDPMTGMPNRRQMLPWLREEAERRRRGGARGCVCMIDLDYFKNINDALGHHAGDAVLEMVARYILKTLRPYDSAYRYGGDEFLLCLPNTDPDTVRGAMNRLRAGIESLPVETSGKAGTILRLGASIGIAELDPEVTVEEVIARADHAMLAAKETGRDRVIIWHPQ